MIRTPSIVRLTALGLALLATTVLAAEAPLASLKLDTPQLKSANALTFGPNGILFVGDSQAATVFAIDTGDRTASDSKERTKVENLDEKIASLLGIEAGQLLINDLVVNPISRNTYLSISRGKGPDAQAVLIKVDRSGKVSEFALKGAPYASAKLPNASTKEKNRRDVITDMAYTKGQLLVAGLSNEEFASNLRAIPFPFDEVNNGAGVEIFHGAHGRLETASPVRTFVPYDLNGETQLLAAYTCTPLVMFPVSQLKPGAKVKGTTIAELGNRNRPLDMIVYKKDGKEFILLANSDRGVMKIPTDGIQGADSIQTRINGTAGLKYETIGSLKGVQHLDKFDEGHAILLVKGNDGSMQLRTIELP
jgi:hypothetical protein